MKYIAKRHVDKYMPGDEVDPQDYDPQTLAKMVANGMIAAEGEVEEKPKPKAKTTK